MLDLSHFSYLLVFTLLSVLLILKKRKRRETNSPSPLPSPPEKGTTLQKQNTAKQMSSFDGFPVLSLKGILSEEEEIKSLMIRRQSILNSNTPKNPPLGSSKFEPAFTRALSKTVPEKTHSRSQSFGSGRKEKETFNTLVGYSGADLEEETKTDFLQRTFPLAIRGQEDYFLASRPVKRKSSFFMQYDQIQEKPNKYYSKFPPEDEDIEYPILIPNFNYMSQPSPSMFSSSASPIFSSFSSSNFPYPSHSGTSAVTSSDNFFLCPSTGIPLQSHSSFVLNDKQFRKNSSSETFEEESNPTIFTRSNSCSSMEPKSELSESESSEGGPPSHQLLRSHKMLNEPQSVEFKEQPQKYRKMNSPETSILSSEEQMKCDDYDELSHSLTGRSEQLLQNGYVGPEEVGRLSASSLVLENSEDNTLLSKASLIRHPLQTSQEVKRLYEEEHKSFDSEDDSEDEEEYKEETTSQRALFEESGYVFKDEILHEPTPQPTQDRTYISAVQPKQSSETSTLHEKPQVEYGTNSEAQKKSASTPLIPHISHPSLLFDPTVLNATEAFLSHLSRSLSVASVPHDKEKEKELNVASSVSSVTSTPTTSFASTCSSTSQQLSSIQNAKVSSHASGALTQTSRRTKSWTQSELMLQSPYFSSRTLR
eukprot:TRINITY_DN4677_c0_g4_i1.p1 TRINITY_DN4677_c0_g4~~TRINITY_DN4677_c0_g4_i1.p1  ORF type:complete len:650 (+),score=108.08 TRINITY_DN4677_c0_g4_i1:87-2036(+)